MNAVNSTDSTVSQAWLTLATFNRPEEAEGLGQCLRDEGIRVWVYDERKLQKAWFLARPAAGIHVRVPETEFEQAQAYVENSPKAAPYLAGAIRCPSCQSMRVQYPQMTRRNILPTLVAQVLVLTRVMNRECYCESCHFTWDPRSPSAP